MGWHAGRPRTLALATALAMVLVALAAGCSSSPARTAADGVLHPSGYPVGVSLGERLATVSTRELDATLDGLVAVGANWIRIDISWASVQASGPESYSWEQVDRVLDAAQTRGLKVLGVVAYTPPWARPDDCLEFSCPPRDNAEFAGFATDVATRYAGKLTAMEIWNEPNLPVFWTAPDGLAYGNLLATTLAAVHGPAPDLPVLFGGLAARPSGGDGTVSPDDFLRAACTPGNCEGVAAIGYHPYTYPRSPLDTRGPATAWQAMTRPSSLGPSLRSVMDESGLFGTPIWVTEYGAPTSGSGGGAVNEKAQAALVGDGIAAARGDDKIGGVFLYTWQDSHTDGSNEDYFGLLRTNGDHKPAYRAFTDAASAPS